MGKIKLSSKSSDLNYPAIKPTLNLNFAATKTLDPRITFSRNSIGTYVDVDGYIKTAVANQPRFDHDPLTGKCLGLLMEEQRTNFNTNSGGFLGFSEIGGNYQADVEISPDGTLTADLFSSSLSGYLQKDISYVAGQTYTFSAFVKPNFGSLVRIQIYNLGYTGEFRATWNLSNNMVSYEPLGTAPTVTNQGIDNYPNGWKRIRISFNFATASFSAVRLAFWHETAGQNNYYVWGLQLELGSYPTSYIPTSGSTVTRLADSATITGTNFSSWYNTSEGTLLSIGEIISSGISSNTGLNIVPSSSSTRTVSNLLYYPKVIEYATLKSMNAYGYSYPSSSIVTSGLLLNLDAGNTQSYSGSGSTTWTDLSGNGNNGTLTNGPTYSSSNGGSIVFDGVNDYATVPSTNGLYLANTSQVSVSCWGRTNDVNIENQNLVMWEDIVNSDNIEPIRLSLTGLAASNSSFNPIFSVVNSSGEFVNLVSISTIINSTYYNLVGTYDGTTAKLYINGTLNNQVSFSGNFRTPTSGESAKWIIGRGEVSRGDRLLNGNIAQVSIYNRALTASEIQQNFNALRGRF